ncbi:hypothetical protein AAG906_031966 [Vitis piasezkii]
MGCAQVDPYKGSAGIGHPITYPTVPVGARAHEACRKEAMGGPMGSWSAPLVDRLSGLRVHIFLYWTFFAWGEGSLFFFFFSLGGWDVGRSSWGSDGRRGWYLGLLERRQRKWWDGILRKRGASSVGSPVAWLDSADASGCRWRALKERSCSCSKE